MINHSTLFIYKKAIDFIDIFIKFAQTDKLLQTLDPSNVAPEVKEFVLSLPKEQIGFAVGQIKKNPYISVEQLQEFLDKLKEKENKKLETDQELANLLPNLWYFPNKEWFITQLRKFPNHRELLLRNIRDIISFVDAFNINLASYNFEELMHEMVSEVGLLYKEDNKIFEKPKTSIDHFFEKIKNQEDDRIKEIIDDDPNLKSWLRNQFMKIRKEWKQKIEKYMKDTNKSFEDIVSEAKNIMNAQQAGELRGQELTHTPLHHPEHGNLLEQIEPIFHWHIDHRLEELKNISMSEILAKTRQWELEESKKGAKYKYDPITQDRIVYGPDNWKNPEYQGYFIIELNSKNDLKTEGFLMNHCVGSYCWAVEDGMSRIFSLRNMSNPEKPILTIETDPGGFIVRQDYGPRNRKIADKYHNMVNEWTKHTKQAVKDNILTQQSDLRDRIRLASDPDISSEIQLILAVDRDMTVKRNLAANPNITPETQLILFNGANNNIDKEARLDILTRLAENHNLSPELQLRFAKDPALNAYLVENPNITPEVQMILIKNPKLFYILIKNPNLAPQIKKYLGRFSDEYRHHTEELK